MHFLSLPRLLHTAEPSNLLSFVSIHSPVHSFRNSSVFYLNYNSSSLLYLLAFVLFSISCIVIASISSHNPPNQFGHTCHIHPISSSPIEEINAVTHFIQYSITSDQSSVFSQIDDDIENQRTNELPIPESPDASKIFNLEHTSSDVTLTFGSDKPEVYMKMAEQTQKRFLCRCPCNHRSPELAAFPHVSNTSTISSNLSVHTRMYDADSLSSVGSKKQPISLETLASSSTETKLDTLVSSLDTYNNSVVVKHTHNLDTFSSGLIIINDSETDISFNKTTNKQLIAKNNVTCGLAYTKMKTMVPFLHPAILIRWVTLKIMVSFYVFTKGLYRHALEHSLFRRFQQ